MSGIYCPYIKIRGIIHCHSSLSHDSDIDLEELVRLLKSKGFSFAALTEHSRDVTEMSYSALLDKCKELSSPEFVVIPGLEIRVSGNMEIAAIGVDGIIDEFNSIDWTIIEIHRLNGFAVFVHPHKYNNFNYSLYYYDAIEFMNGKLDGYLAPSISHFRHVRRYLNNNKAIFCIAGLDIHSIVDPKNIWITCDVRDVSRDAILICLKNGLFVNCTQYMSIGSHGEIAVMDWYELVLLRMAYILWNNLLAYSSRRARDILISASRRIVNSIKKC